jgi:2-hydroxychromene-2-carboxylate isomerase
MACWGEGKPLTEISVLEEVVDGLGLDSDGLGKRIAEPSVKSDLHDLTREALELGVFGVPTFEYEGELFWGHDRLDHLAARLSRRLAAAGPELDVLTRRPRGATRRRAPDKR